MSTQEMYKFLVCKYNLAESQEVRPGQEGKEALFCLRIRLEIKLGQRRTIRRPLPGDI